MRARHFGGYGCNEMEQQTRYFQCDLLPVGLNKNNCEVYIQFSKINVRGMKYEMDFATIL